LVLRVGSGRNFAAVRIGSHNDEENYRPERDLN